MIELDKIVTQLSNLTIIEASKLASKLKEKWGITDTYNVNNTTSINKTQTKINTKTSFTVILKAIGIKKIEVIKTIKKITGLMLKEAKELVDSVPSTIKENIPKEEANEIKKALNTAGAEIEIK